MADRRMFSKTIIDSDAFLEMPLSSQALYFHLSMRADDDGFINNPKKIQRMIGSSGDDLKILITKKFIIPFDSGIVVIKHWKIHNYIQKDRYKSTVYQEEKSMLIEKNNRAYKLDTHRIQDVNSLDTQIRLGKDSIDKSSIEEEYIVEETIDYTSIITYLNGICGTSYKPSSKKTQTLIKARMNEGFTYDDFKTVIDKKYHEWKNSDMSKYLRPETLFGTKFEGYLNQKEKRTLKNLDVEADYSFIGGNNAK